MYPNVRKNFEEKVSYVASIVPDMSVIDAGSFLLVDCGLPSDTFNIIVVRDMSASYQILASIDSFTSKGFPMAVWCWESDVDATGRATFIQHGLSHPEIDTAMYADLTQIHIAPLAIEGLEIHRAVTATDLLHVGNVMANLFGNSDEGEQVRAYFQHLSKYPLNLFPAMHHYFATLYDTTVAIGTLFIGSETAGIYDVVTSDAYRRRGIGSAMFQHLLADARSCSRRFCVLQASPDGLGIYTKAGFRPIDTVHVFENRGLLS